MSTFPSGVSFDFWPNHTLWTVCDGWEGGEALEEEVGERGEGVLDEKEGERGEGVLEEKEGERGEDVLEDALEGVLEDEVAVAESASISDRWRLGKAEVC